MTCLPEVAKILEVIRHFVEGVWFQKIFLSILAAHVFNLWNSAWKTLMGKVPVSYCEDIAANDTTGVVADNVSS